MRGIKHELAVYRGQPLEAASAETMESGSFLGATRVVSLYSVAQLASE